MELNLVWLLVGITAAATLNSVALTSDYLGIVLPLLSFALSIVILLIGTRTAGLGFFRAMALPIGLGNFFLLSPPLPGMAILPVILGIWFGMANRLLARPLSVLGLIGQTSPIAAAGLLFWRHLHIYPAWTLAGLFCYAILSNRSSGRRVLSCG